MTLGDWIWRIEEILYLAFMLPCPEWNTRYFKDECSRYLRQSIPNHKGCWFIKCMGILSSLHSTARKQIMQNGKVTRLSPGHPDSSLFLKQVYLCMMVLTDYFLIF